MRTLYSCQVCCPDELIKRPENFDKYPSGKMRKICRQCRSNEANARRKRTKEFDVGALLMGRRWT